jgi:hypothetical protein
MDSQHFFTCIISVWRWINSSLCTVSLSVVFVALVLGTHAELFGEMRVGMSNLSCWIHKCWQGSGAKHQGTLENGIFIK